MLHSRQDPPAGCSPVVHLPELYQIRDFTKGADPSLCPYSIGRYDEIRPGMYTSSLFTGGRCLHIGIDIGAPVGEPVYSARSGYIFSLGILPDKGDYGHSIVVEHRWNNQSIWALYGHLSAASLSLHSVGDQVHGGDLIGWLGTESENGGWPPHLHYQLSWTAPEGHDMPGVVHPDQRDLALSRYPDPRLFLGSVY